LQKEDKKLAKIMEYISNSQFKEYEGIIEAIISCRNYIKVAYGIDAEDCFWNRIMEEVVKKDLNLTK
jgi:hypothetical protein